MEQEPAKKYPLNTHPANQPDEYVRCPYFPEHELRKSRLLYHLLKCQANPMAPKLLACPYNYLHRIRPEDKQEHLILCEDRIMTKYANRVIPSYANTRKQCFGLVGETKPREGADDENEDGEEWW